MRPEPSHIIILLVIIILLFGASKLPSLARNLGKSAKIFRDEVKSMNDDSNETPAELESSRSEDATDKAARSHVDSTQSVRDTDK
ncbi:Sec-independent protein translocase subunit TatA [Brevibacterium sp. UMB1308A]|uniref:Sec-independent protein translocase subunit TatA n=1 Tax=Brevibacterium sp. UMB1308A TaxID=3050608 RepID=UPI00254E744C|nr:Sec-independent protein translocase subunit TatA [Brevibacterium sp. UMB1308A]MDK8345373.1 Sec-independent protein translocase subunit TatA [Brevibacterium sp. UMB1308B]MDK8713772.1 Sec-independent protein translocase subunit TatA [Brevibacterium sp. UMB1308A]